MAYYHNQWPRGTDYSQSEPLHPIHAADFSVKTQLPVHHFNSPAESATHAIPTYTGDADSLSSKKPATQKSTKHKKPKRKQVKNACVNCQKACKKCDDGRPCQRCIKLGLTSTCTNSPRKERKAGVKRGPYRKRPSAGKDLYDLPNTTCFENTITQVSLSSPPMVPSSTFESSHETLTVFDVDGYVDNKHMPTYQQQSFERQPVTESVLGHRTGYPSAFDASSHGCLLSRSAFASLSHEPMHPFSLQAFTEQWTPGTQVSNHDFLPGQLNAFRPNHPSPSPINQGLVPFDIHQHPVNTDSHSLSSYASSWSPASPKAVSDRQTYTDSFSYTTLTQYQPKQQPQLQFQQPIVYSQMNALDPFHVPRTMPVTHHSWTQTAPYTTTTF